MSAAVVFTYPSIAVLSQILSSYSVANLGRDVVVSGPDGNAITVGISQFRFADGSVNTNDGNPLVDALYYDRSYQDVFHAGVNPAQHYDQYGWHEGRDPDAYFSTKGYLNANPDVKAAGIDPLTHYDQYGWKEGRNPSAQFDTEYYLLHNPDVAAAGVDPLLHFLTDGLYEGRLV